MRISSVIFSLFLLNVVNCYFGERLEKFLREKEASCGQGICFENAQYMRGGGKLDDKNRETSSKEECAELCKSTIGCCHWTWSGPNHRAWPYKCWLKYDLESIPIEFSDEIKPIYLHLAFSPDWERGTLWKTANLVWVKSLHSTSTKKPQREMCQRVLQRTCNLFACSWWIQ